MELTVNKPSKGLTITVEYDEPDSVDAAIVRWGDEAVLHLLQTAIKASLNSFVGTRLEQGRSREDIEAAMREWTPGVRRRGRTQYERAKDELAALSIEDRIAILQALKEDMREIQSQHAAE